MTGILEKAWENMFLTSAWQCTIAQPPYYVVFQSLIWDSLYLYDHVSAVLYHISAFYIGLLRGIPGKSLLWLVACCPSNLKASAGSI